MGLRNHSSRPVVDCSAVPSRTVQSEKQACDINWIVAQYRRTGNIAHLARGVPQFVDVSEVGDFRSVLDQVRQTEEWFMRLPSGVRTKFDNRVENLMDALADRSRWKELEDVGLVPTKVLEEKAADAAGAHGST